MSEKTRCKQCFYSDKQVQAEPCNKCGEIHYKDFMFENHFIPADKNLLDEAIKVVK